MDAVSKCRHPSDEKQILCSSIGQPDIWETSKAGWNVNKNTSKLNINIKVGQHSTVRLPKRHELLFPYSKMGFQQTENCLTFPNAETHSWMSRPCQRVAMCPCPNVAATVRSASIATWSCLKASCLEPSQAFMVRCWKCWLARVLPSAFASFPSQESLRNLIFCTFFSVFFFFFFFSNTQPHRNTEHTEVHQAVSQSSTGWCEPDQAKTIALKRLRPVPLGPSIEFQGLVPGHTAKQRSVNSFFFRWPVDAWYHGLLLPHRAGRQCSRPSQRSRKCPDLLQLPNRCAEGTERVCWWPRAFHIWYSLFFQNKSNKKQHQKTYDICPISFFELLCISCTAVPQFSKIKNHLLCLFQATMVLLHLSGFKTRSSSKQRRANSGKSFVPLGAWELRAASRCSKISYKNKLRHWNINYKWFTWL